MLSIALCAWKLLCQVESTFVYANRKTCNPIISTKAAVSESPDSCSALLRLWPRLTLSIFPRSGVVITARCLCGSGVLGVVGCQDIRSCADLVLAWTWNVTEADSCFVLKGDVAPCCQQVLDLPFTFHPLSWDSDLLQIFTCIDTFFPPSHHVRNFLNHHFQFSGAETKQDHNLPKGTPLLNSTTRIQTRACQCPTQ